VRTRPLVALSVAAVSALLLVGCSSPAPESTPDSSASASGDLCAAVVPSGAASDGVSVEGEPGEPATATFTTPLEITSAERTVVVEGDGAAIEDGDIVEYGVTVFDPATGEEVAVEGYASPILPVSVALGSGADQFFGCAPVGSRIVMALPETEQSAAAVWVLDVLGVDTEPRAEGEAQEPVDGFPTVVLAEDGAPTVTIPEGDIPTEFDKATLIKGEGDVIAAGDAVLVQYHGVSWNDGEVFDQSWGGAPFPFSTSGGVVQGFADAVIGETVGSQVIAVLPPAVAYGEGEINENDLVGQTLVFVVDILAVQPAVTE
jgi:peptidylprolyl isomerase